MDYQFSTSPPDRLVTFCSLVVSRHSAHWPPTEERLAKDFVAFSGFKSLFRFEDIQQFAESLGIRVFLSSTLPRQLYGFNGCYEEQRTVVICEEKGLLYSTREHTLLHEIREILEYIFCSLGCPTVEGKLPEVRAEEFATSARVDASMEFLKDGMEHTRTIESKWKRRTAYALIGILGFGSAISCIMLPALEDYIDRRGRALRT